MNTRNLICISCPRGCHLAAVRENDADLWNITGNQCPNGEKYARQELSSPCRVVTATVHGDCPSMPMIPVRTDKELPVKSIARLLNKLYSIKVKTPVKAGEILLDDVEHLGVQVIFSCDCP